MSLLPAHPCTAPGCPALVTGSRSRCEKHSSDVLRGTALERGYDRHHQILRVVAFQRDNWRCVDCGWEPDIVTLYRTHGIGTPETSKILNELRHRQQHGLKHLHCDHIEPISRAPRLRLELDNLATRCDHCHNVKTAKEFPGGGFLTQPGRG